MVGVGVVRYWAADSDRPRANSPTRIRERFAPKILRMDSRSLKRTRPGPIDRNFRLASGLESRRLHAGDVVPGHIIDIDGNDGPILFQGRYRVVCGHPWSENTPECAGCRKGASEP